MPFFGKNTKVIVHGFVKKRGFSGGEWNQTVLCFDVRIYALKLRGMFVGLPNQILMRIFCLRRSRETVTC